MFVAFFWFLIAYSMHKPKGGLVYHVTYVIVYLERQWGRGVSDHFVHMLFILNNVR